MHRRISPGLGFTAIAVCCGITLGCTDKMTTTSGTMAETTAGQIMNTGEQISAAIDDLAAKRAIDPSEIEVESARAVQWRSGAGGCPEPGMSYTMAVVPGVQILLKAGGEMYRYHATRDGAPAFCPAERAEAPVYGQGEEVM